MGAITYKLCLNERFQDLSKLGITDSSIYGTTNPDRRIDAARFLIGAKMNDQQVLSYIPTIINTDYINQVEWQFDNAGLGAYRFFYISVPFYSSIVSYVKPIINSNGSVTQYGNIVYDAGVFYKVKSDATASPFSNIEPGVTSGWENYWEVISEDSFKNEYLNDKITVFISDDISTGEFDQCLLDTLSDLTDLELLNTDPTSPDYFNVLKMELMLDSAESENWQGQATRAETILINSKKKYCC